jgi:hypothetical protein
LQCYFNVDAFAVASGHGSDNLSQGRYRPTFLADQSAGDGWIATDTEARAPAATVVAGNLHSIGITR